MAESQELEKTTKYWIVVADQASVLSFTYDLAEKFSRSPVYFFSQPRLPHTDSSTSSLRISRMFNCFAY